MAVDLSRYAKVWVLGCPNRKIPAVRALIAERNGGTVDFISARIGVADIEKRVSSENPALLFWQGSYDHLIGQKPQEFADRCFIVHEFSLLRNGSAGGYGLVLSKPEGLSHLERNEAGAPESTYKAYLDAARRQAPGVPLAIDEHGEAKRIVLVLGTFSWPVIALRDGTVFQNEQSALKIIVDRTRQANPDAVVRYIDDPIIADSPALAELRERHGDVLAHDAVIGSHFGSWLQGVSQVVGSPCSAMYEALLRGIPAEWVEPENEGGPASSSEVLFAILARHAVWVDARREPIQLDDLISGVIAETQSIRDPRLDRIGEARQALAYDEALTLIDLVLKERMADKAMYRTKAEVLMAAGRPADAEAVLRTLLEKHPRDCAILRDIAHARQKLGRQDEEVGRAMRRAFELSGGSIHYFEDYLELEWERGAVNDELLSKASAFIAGALRKQPEGLLGRRNLLLRFAAILNEFERKDEALRIYRQAIKRGENPGGFPNLRASMEALGVPKSKTTAVQDKTFQHVLSNRNAFRDIVHKANGDVVIVGNGPQQLGKGTGAFIDSKSAIIRFNTYNTTFPFSHDYGTKTNIWVRMPPCAYVRKESHDDLDLILVTGGNKLHRPFNNWKWVSGLVDQGQRVQFLPKEPFYDLSRELGAIPTAGLVLAYMLYQEIGPLSEEHVLGCSFAAESSNGTYHYSDDRAAVGKRHEFDAERAFFLKYLSNVQSKRYYTPLIAGPVRQAETKVALDGVVEAVDASWSLDGLAGSYDRVLSASPGLKGYRLFGRDVEVVSRKECLAALVADDIPSGNSAFPVLGTLSRDQTAIVLGFGLGPTGTLGSRLAKKLGASYSTVEFGLISSFYLPSEKKGNFSLIVDDLGVFYDSTRPNRIESLLSQASKLDQARAKNFIDYIVSNNVTKYNNAPDISLGPKRKDVRRILVVDQTAGDLSIKYGNCQTYSFNDMLNHALGQVDAEVYLKPHPEALAGAKEANFDLDVLRRQPGLIVLKDNCNVMSLLKQVDEVYVMTSGVGFEALMAGVKVRCFGSPFYSGLGLTKDMVKPARHRRQANIESLAAAVFFNMTQFYDPITLMPCSAEEAVEKVVNNRDQSVGLVKMGSRVVSFRKDDKHQLKYLEIESDGRVSIDGLIADAFVPKGGVVVDAGANIGYTAIKYAEAGASRVYAFEPVSSIFSQLERLKDDVIMPVNIALGDFDGKAEIRLSTSHAQGHSLSPDMAQHFPGVFEGEARTENIEVRRLDSFYEESRLDFIKVDVEGFEGELLKGARQVLDALRPAVIQMELYEHQVAGITDVLKDLYPHVWRAVIRKSSNTLELLSTETEPDPKTFKALGPPVYVFSRAANPLVTVKRNLAH